MLVFRASMLFPETRSEGSGHRFIGFRTCDSYRRRSSQAVWAGRDGADQEQGTAPSVSPTAQLHGSPQIPSFRKTVCGQNQGPVQVAAVLPVEPGGSPGAADSEALWALPPAQCVSRQGWFQSRASPRGSVSLESWGGSEAQGPGPVPHSGASTICSDGAEVEQGHGDRPAWAWLSPSSCGLPAWPGSVEQGQGGGGAWPRTRARVTGQLPEERPGVHTLSNFLWL